MLLAVKIDEARIKKDDLMLSRITQLYTRLVFGHPIWTLLILLVAAGIFGSQVGNFRLDASADSLLLEGDKDLEYSRFIGTRYGTSDSVIVAYTPDEDLFSRPVLTRLQALSGELLTIDHVEGVDSILNVPVFVDTPLMGISENYLTVMDPELDLIAAREELVSSPIFSNAVISSDGQTAGMLVSFAPDEKLRGLLQQRMILRIKASAEGLNAEETSELRAVEAEYDEYTVETATRQS
jgi:hypothetical protein